jgi:hypothetical protein
MTRPSSLAFAAGAVLSVLLLGACASPPTGATGTRPDDIVRIPLASSGPITGEPQRVRREETLRRELGVDHAPDGSWDGCFVRGWGAGC